MTDFGQIGITDAQVDLLDVATNFCREKSPISKVREQLLSETGFDADIWTEISNLGWLAIVIPEDYDGVGLNMAEVVPVVEQMGRRLLATPFIATTLTAQAILMGGTDAQKAMFLPRLAAGNIGSCALLEPHHDWDISNVEAKLTPEADGYSLSGQKRFVPYGPMSDIVVVTALLDGKPIAVVLEGKDIPAKAWRREVIVDETQRTYVLSLDGISLSADALFEVSRISEMLAHLDMTRNLLSAAYMCGGTQAVIDYTIEYLQTRKQFGKVIGGYQALKHPLVDAYVDYEKARSLLYAAAFSFCDQGTGEVAVRMAKAQSDKSYAYAADRSIQFHGGFGFTYDCDAQLYRRAAVFEASQTGDSAYHRAKLAELLF